MDELAAPGDVLALLNALRRRTPARLLVGRAGTSYRTETQLDLRADHCLALDAVRRELDIDVHLGAEFVREWGLFEVATECRSKDEYLMRPDRGRRLSDPARAEVVRRCPMGPALQVIIGDGLSVAAVATQVPKLLPLIAREAGRRGWGLGQTFVVRYCRVGVLNVVGDLLGPEVAVLLIGERPGLSTVEGLSAYMAHRPRSGQTDAHRNLISNIHDRGTPVEGAAVRVLDLAERMRALGTGGVAVKID